MPKKTKFTKEAVIEAGLMELRESGWKGVTPKTVAKRLGASTMPIFSHFSTMEEFREAILRRGREIQMEYVTRSYTGDIWVDQGIGYVLFARDQGHIFSCMYDGTRREVHLHGQRFWKLVSGELDGHPSFEGMSAGHIGLLRIIRGALAHGIAVSINSGLSKIYDNEDVIRMMISLCSEVLCEGLSKRGDKLDEISSKISAEAREKLNQVPAG